VGTQGQGSPPAAGHVYCTGTMQFHIGSELGIMRMDMDHT